MVKRLLSQKILKTKKSILLLGPRQTGKSTLLTEIKPDLIINLARENEFLRYSTDIDLFTSQIEQPKVNTILVDEIQRIPSLLNSIQAIIDESKNSKRPKRFLISGSSPRKLKKGQANLLPGRVFAYQLSGLCAKEVDYKLNIRRALRFGVLPEPYLESNDEYATKLLESYSATYLKEEIQAEALLRNIQGFARFLMVLATSAGQVLDLSKLASKAKVARTSTHRFIEVLEDTLIAQRLECFNEAPTADVIRHPKLYFFDVGVLNGLLNNFSPSADRIGILFEHLVYSQIRNSAIAHDQTIQFYFFRTRHGLEVDLILRHKNKIWAIEIKSSDPSASDLSGLKAFKTYYPHVHKCVLVTPSGPSRQKDGVLICNLIHLLKELGF